MSVPEVRCDLVLLSWNHPECTQPCVESILAHTATPSRLIIVDQGSDEETRSYLRTLRSTTHVAIEIVWNPANVGYPKGMNIGLKRATAPYVCFLNNDILVPPGWLEELIAVAESDPTIGAVNPSSNTFSIHPPKGSDYLQLARRLASRRGKWIEVSYGVGFCLLASREVLLKVGGFDEATYERIYFEDADLGRQLQALGLRCVMAQGTYVWHHGGRSTAQVSQRRRLFEENERRFIAKWGKGRRVLYAMIHPTKELLERLRDQAREEANRPGDVWLFVSGKNSSEQLPHHLSIRVSRYPRWQMWGVILWKALTKKKRFDRIVTNDKILRQVLQGLHFLHHAEVKSLR